MQVNFDELKILYKSLFVNVDDLVVGGKEVSVEVLKNSEAAYDRLELIAKFATELCKYRPMRVDKD